MSEINSKIFAPYRALGINSDHVPCVIRYNRQHQETYVVTSVGKSFHVYKCSNMGLIRVSDLLEDEINCLAIDARFIYAAAGAKCYAFLFGRKVEKTFEGHEGNVTHILPFVAHLLTIDDKNVFRVFDIATSEIYLKLEFAKESFEITSMLHPVSYLNKILFGSKQGGMQLWNIKSSQLIYTFKSFGSAITVLKQAPATDVAGVGLENGKIILHNLKFDETIMTFTQDWGPIRSLAFRTDGSPTMITGSILGHMAVWNLEEKRLVAQIREAHTAGVDGIQCLQYEPLMVTSSSDNSVKIWIFDMSDGSARLLRQRHGHSQPSTKINFHGLNGHNILSAGLDSCLMSFSTEHDSKNKSLGRASFNKVETKRRGLKLDQHKMPPIVDFSSNETKQSDWDSIVCVHENLRMVTTWDYLKSTMGKHKIDHERFKNHETVYGSVIATCCTISNCGNYFVVGYSSGHADLYNIQSGLIRATYGNPVAHDSAVRGVASDALNMTTITCSSNGEISFWPFKHKNKLSHCFNQSTFSMKLDECIDKITFNRDNGMLAIATDDFNVLVVDSEVKKVVRRFAGHSNKISDMTFSPDSRWLITASMDCLVKVWDLPSSKLIDCMRFEQPAISVCMSPTFEYLATAHVNDVAIYLWSNKTLYSHVPLRQLPDNYEPLNIVKMPSSSYRPLNDSDSDDLDRTDLDDSDYDDYRNYTSPEQIDLDLVTLSLLPESRWKNLINLDVIKKRNKPKEPPKVPKLAPFFLPTVSNEQGFSFKSTLESKEKNLKESSHMMANLFLSDFAIKLSESKTSQDYNNLLDEMKKMGPSAIDAELRSLSEDMGGSLELMERFLKFILHHMTTRRNFELVSSYLGLFLKLHADAVSNQDELCNLLEQINEVQSIAWSSLKTSFNKNLCLVGYFKSVV